MEAHVQAYVDVYYADDAAVLADGELARFWDVLATASADIRTHRYNGDAAGHLGALRGKADLVEKLSFFAWQVTGYHNHVGNVADYLLAADFAGAKIRKGATQSDVQASFQGLMIGLMTAMKAPKLLPTQPSTNFTHLLLRDAHLTRTTAIFHNYQGALAALSAQVDARNAARLNMPCNSYNPRHMTSSVSI